MPIETWSYVPQRVFVATATAAVDVVAPSPRAEVVGWASERILREFRLEYTLVPSQTANSMAAFYTARNGPLEAFVFRAPTDARTYLVRFSDEMVLEYFTPGLFRTQPLVFTEVVS